jgi:ribosomal protein S27E
MNRDRWVCPICGYIIDDIVFTHFSYDVGCARCKTSLLDFNFRKGKIDEPEGKEEQQ